MKTGLIIFAGLGALAAVAYFAAKQRASESEITETWLPNGLLPPGAYIDEDGAPRTADGDFIPYL